MTAEPGQHQDVCLNEIATFARNSLVEKRATTLLPLPQISKKEGEVELCCAVVKPALPASHRHCKLLIVIVPVVERVPVSQTSLWQFLPAELLKDIACRLLEQTPRSANLAGGRQTCKLWRNAVSEVVQTMVVPEDWGASSTRSPGFLESFTQLKQLYNLPSHQLSSLKAKLPLEVLTVTGTATDSDIAVLAGITTLQQLHFSGPITLTTERFCMLGCQPLLTALVFWNVLFPRTPYGEHACKVAQFPKLQSLELHMSHPLTRNGEESGAAGRQFLLAMKCLLSLTIDANAVTQVLLETLDKLPALKQVHLLGSPSTLRLEQWGHWASPKCVHVYLHGYLVCPYPAN